jgi:hypothetical protein
VSVESPATDSPHTAAKDRTPVAVGVL